MQQGLKLLDKGKELLANIDLSTSPGGPLGISEGAGGQVAAQVYGIRAAPSPKAGAVKARAVPFLLRFPILMRSLHQDVPGDPRARGMLVVAKSLQAAAGETLPWPWAAQHLLAQHGKELAGLYHPRALINTA